MNFNGLPSVGKYTIIIKRGRNILKNYCHSAQTVLYTKILISGIGLFLNRIFPFTQKNMEK